MCACFIFAAYTLSPSSLSQTLLWPALNYCLPIFSSCPPSNPSSIHSFILLSCISPDRTWSFPFFNSGLPPSPLPSFWFLSPLSSPLLRSLAVQEFLPSSSPLINYPLSRSLPFLLPPLTSHLFFTPFSLPPHLFAVLHLPIFAQRCSSSMSLTSAVSFNLSLPPLPVHLLHLLSCYLSHYVIVICWLFPPRPPYPSPSPSLSSSLFFLLAVAFMGTCGEAVVAHLEL